MSIRQTGSSQDTAGPGGSLHRAEEHQPGTDVRACPTHSHDGGGVPVRIQVAGGLLLHGSGGLLRHGGLLRGGRCRN